MIAHVGDLFIRDSVIKHVLFQLLLLLDVLIRHVCIESLLIGGRAFLHELRIEFIHIAAVGLIDLTDPVEILKVCRIKFLGISI